MSGKDGVKTVTFQARTKKKGSVKKQTATGKSNAALQGPKTGVEQVTMPNQIGMAGGPAGTDRTREQLQATPLRARGVPDEQFPTADLVKPDEKDAMMAAKLEAQQVPIAPGVPVQPGLTPFGQLVANDSMFQWLMDKREQEAEANFQQWFATYFDHMSPEQKKLARELFPAFYKQREETLAKNVALAHQLAYDKLMGIQDKNGLARAYAVESGFIPADPLENILHPERSAQVRNAAARQAAFSRGLFNPRRLPRGDQGAARLRGPNAAMLTGRQYEAFGENPAYLLGTNIGGVQRGFSAVGATNPAQERHANVGRELQQVVQPIL